MIYMHIFIPVVMYYNITHYYELSCQQYSEIQIDN